VATHSRQYAPANSEKASHHAPVDSKYPSSIADAEMLYFEYRLMKRDGSHHVPIFHET